MTTGACSEVTWSLLTQSADTLAAYAECRPTETKRKRFDTFTVYSTNAKSHKMFVESQGVQFMYGLNDARK